ncbi:hypothetical protein QF027_001746 [Streptomyces canus]|nr:hypothetical protein [Streptomyces canus]
MLSGATNRSAENPELGVWMKAARAKVVRDLSPACADLQVHRVAVRNVNIGRASRSAQGGGRSVWPCSRLNILVQSVP